MKITIAGAGIGGLTAALALHQAGHDVAVYESVSTSLWCGYQLTAPGRARTEATWCWITCLLKVLQRRN